MALSTKDGLWDRNFQSFDQKELDKDTKLDDEIQIKWVNSSCLKRRNVSLLIMANDKSCHIYNALLKDAYHKLGSIDYVNYKVNIHNSQRGIAQKVIIYSNKDPKRPKIAKMSELGAAAAMMAQSGQLNDEQANKSEIIFVYAPNVPQNFHFCISEFILMHFRPQKVVCFDLISRGQFVQNFDEMKVPQMRKIVTSNLTMTKDDEKENGMEFVQNVKYLECGNLISSLSAALLQQCELSGNIFGYLFVSISDLDYLTETLMSFASILIDFCLLDLSQIFDGMKGNKLQKVVTKKCAKYANKSGHLSIGRNIFG